MSVLKLYFSVSQIRVKKELLCSGGRVAGYLSMALLNQDLSSL